MKNMNVINEKVKYFFNKKNKVHIEISSNRFYNGIIISVHKEKEFLVLMDSKLGEVPVMFEEIETIEPFVEG